MMLWHMILSIRRQIILATFMYKIGKTTNMQTLDIHSLDGLAETLA